MLMHRRARYRLGSVYEIINNRVKPRCHYFYVDFTSEIHILPGLYFPRRPFRYIRTVRDVDYSGGILLPDNSS